MKHRLALASVRGMTPALARELVDLLGSEEAFFATPATRLRQMTGSRARIYDDDYRARKLAEAATELAEMERRGIRAVYFTDPDYPQRLLQCEDAPLLLYAAGSAPLNPQRTLAVVGTRHATAYGLEFTRRMVDDLARLVPDTVIISGLAYGIDIEAHRSALRCGLPTAAVLAHGLNTIYPAEHRATAAEMVRRGGALLTEYTTAQPIHKGNFVARNRIVAGMADALVVVESARKGGALITARLAGEYNRDVFAVPGRVTDPYSAGCNALISASVAQSISSAEELCLAMGWITSPDEPQAAQPTLPLALNPDEEAIVKFLEANGEANVTQLSIATGFPIGKLMSVVVEMECRGILTSLPGALYALL